MGFCKSCSAKPGNEVGLGYRNSRAFRAQGRFRVLSIWALGFIQEYRAFGGRVESFGKAAKARGLYLGD